jgi:hypothetical protein
VGVIDEGEGLMMTAPKRDQVGNDELDRSRSELVRPVVSRWQTTASVSLARASEVPRK